MHLLAEKIKKSSMFTYLLATLRQTVYKMKFRVNCRFRGQKLGGSQAGVNPLDPSGLEVYPAFDLPHFQP